MEKLVKEYLNFQLAQEFNDFKVLVCSTPFSQKLSTMATQCYVDVSGLSDELKSVVVNLLRDEDDDSDIPLVEGFEADCGDTFVLFCESIVADMEDIVDVVKEFFLECMSGYLIYRMNQMSTKFNYLDLSNITATIFKADNLCDDDDKFIGAWSEVMCHYRVEFEGESMSDAAEAMLHSLTEDEINNIVGEK